MSAGVKRYPTTEELTGWQQEAQTQAQDFVDAREADDREWTIYGVARALDESLSGSGDVYRYFAITSAVLYAKALGFPYVANIDYARLGQEEARALAAQDEFYRTHDRTREATS